MNRVAVIIPNYNMAERADALHDAITARAKWPHDIFIVDNASDQVHPAENTAVRLEKNVQTTGAFLAGLEAADEMERVTGEPYFAYWFIITSTDIPEGGDPLSPMAQWLIDTPHAVGIHPALTLDSTSDWHHLDTRGGDQPRRTWMIDNIAALYRADWFNGIGRFDPRFIYAWGIDLETCWRARYDRKSLWVDERVKVRKITNIGYAMNRMGMSAAERNALAGANMREVLRYKYGENYWQIMTEAEVRPEWR